VTPILVLIGSIVNQFIIEGVCFNYATLLEFIQREFQFSSKLIATLPAALLLAFFLLLAPISVFLSKQFGTRRIAVLGTFISTLSLLICSFFSNFVVFVIFYGIFTG
jgi:MFS family permease